MFCLKYYPSKKYIEEADELKIIYRPADRTIKDFIEKFKDKTIIIDVRYESFEEIDAKLLKELFNLYQNIKIVFDLDDFKTLDLAKTYEIPYFFSNPVCSIDMLTGLLDLHPTDMYICEELGFFLDQVSKILHQNNIAVRVYPNICQSSYSKTPSIKTFFIRPEDLEEYAKYVDVFELISDEDRQEIIFKVYKKGRWFGKIKEIIPSFDDPLDSKYIYPYFGSIRAKCHKRCFYKPHSCNICDRFSELAETFKENDIVILKQENEI